MNKFKRIAIYGGTLAFLLVFGLHYERIMVESYHRMGPLAQPMTPLVGHDGKVVWVPDVNKAEAAGVNINTVTASAQAAACDWSVSPYCRVNVAGTALTTLTLGSPGAPSDGSQYTLEFVQGTTGAPVTMPTAVVGNFGAAAPAVNTTASSDTLYILQYVASATKYQVISAIGAGGSNGCAGTTTLASGIGTVTGACLSGASVVSCNSMTAVTPVAGNVVACSVSGGTVKILAATASATDSVGWSRVQ